MQIAPPVWPNEHYFKLGGIYGQNNAKKGGAENSAPPVPCTGGLFSFAAGAAKLFYRRGLTLM